MNDNISRKAAIHTALEFMVEYLGGAFDEDFQKKLSERMLELPPAKPDYTEALSWLLAYHKASFELKGRYLPYEAIGWIVNDFAKIFIEQVDQNE